MVEIIYKTSDGSGYTDKLEACLNDFKWLRNRRDSLLKSLVRMKRLTLPAHTHRYLFERKKARQKQEEIRKSDSLNKSYLVKKEAFEALAKQFSELSDLQIQITVYKKLRAEYKEKAEECKKAFEMYKAVKEGREIKASMGM